MTREAPGSATLTVVVDGNNVVGAAPDGWWRDRPAAVRRLLARLQCYRRSTGHSVVLVLDVAQSDLPEGDHGGVAVRYPPRRGRNAADRRIVELLAAGSDGPVTVVTSDRALAVEAARGGAATVGAGAFLARVLDAGC